ncbi:hypothetical protein ACFL08_05270 [Patescibacteria group bacterium]
MISVITFCLGLITWFFTKDNIFVMPVLFSIAMFFGTRNWYNYFSSSVILRFRAAVWLQYSLAAFCASWIIFSAQRFDSERLEFIFVTIISIAIASIVSFLIYGISENFVGSLGNESAIRRWIIKLVFRGNLKNDLWPDMGDEEFLSRSDDNRVQVKFPKISKDTAKILRKLQGCNSIDNGVAISPKNFTTEGELDDSVDYSGEGPIVYAKRGNAVAIITQVEMIEIEKVVADNISKQDLSDIV